MSHYFDQQPSAASAPRHVELWLPDLSLTLTTDRGVFGHGQIDPGSKLLLLEAPALPASGTFLDLGCGFGTLAVPMALRSPDAIVWAIDINERARQLCVANAEANGATNVRVAEPEDVPESLTFDRIWSNPPIRIGKPALHALLQRWLARLRTDAHAVLVVHRHLGADSLHRWLEEQHYPTERLASSSGYRVLRVSARRVDLDAQP
jgi:16S rRNA (guanine1207-N2)-methyltransferase